MARNRAKPNKVPPPDPETSEEATSEESLSEESGSETKQTQTPAKAKQSAPEKDSSEEEDSGSETESEPDDAPPAKTRLATKPVVEEQKVNDGARSKPTARDPATPTKSAAAKRSAGDASSKESKKLKKSHEPESSEKKANLFQRLWSETDEIVVLKGMIDFDYTSKKKADPVSSLSSFHDFIKEKLEIDATRTQLQDKIRRLKKKYENNKKKEKEGEEKTFSKSHERKSYELSKRIWGNQNIKENEAARVVGSPKSNGRVAKNSKKVNAAEREEANDDVKNAMVVNEEKSPASESQKEERMLSVGASVEERMLSVGASVEARMLAAGQELVGSDVWEKLKVEGFELYLKQLELRAAQTKLVLDAMKGRGH